MVTSPVRRLGSTQIAGLLATLVLLLLHARVYAFLTDDAFISFRYARNLADGFGLVFNPGLERVEGYTNFLWVVILAAFDAVGLAPERIVHVLTILLTLGFWALVARRSVEDASPGEPVWLVGVPCLLLGATRSVAMWSTSGLETRLFELLIVAAVLRLVREIESGAGARTWVSGVFFALATLTRPDGALVALASMGAAAAWTARRARPAGRGDLRRLAAFAAPVAAHLAFRLAYYRAWVPNTYHAKVGGRTWWEMGFTYLGAFVLEYGLVLVAPLVVLGVMRLVKRGAPHVPLLYGAAVLPHVLYVTAIGGDHFEYRPLDLVFPFAYLLAAEGLRMWIASGRLRRLAPVGLVAIVVAVTWLPTRSHLEYPRDRYRPTFPGGDTDDPAAERFLDPARDPLLRWPGLRSLGALHRDLLGTTTARAVGIRQEDHRSFYDSVLPEALRARELVASGRLPRTFAIAVSSVGVLPYYADLPTIDRLGLTDAWVAQADVVSDVRAMAHDLRDTWDYVRRRGVWLSSIRAAHILFEPGDPNLLVAISGAFRSGSTPAYAALDENTLLVGRLPQGVEATRRAHPALAFRSLDDPEALADLVARAIAALNERLSAHPRDSDARIALGQAFLLAGRAGEASQAFERALADAPDRLSALMGLSGARAMRGDRAGALEANHRALDLARRRGATSIARDLEAVGERLRERSGN